MFTEWRTDLHVSGLLGTRIVVGLRVPLGLVMELLLNGTLSKTTRAHARQRTHTGPNLEMKTSLQIQKYGARLALSDQAYEPSSTVKIQLKRQQNKENGRKNFIYF